MDNTTSEIIFEVLSFGAAKRNLDQSNDAESGVWRKEVIIISMQNRDNGTFILHRDTFLFAKTEWRPIPRSIAVIKLKSTRKELPILLY